MACPRCGSELDRYVLGDRESVICPDCHYTGIDVEHGSSGRSSLESWDEALDRFRRRDRRRRFGEEAAVALAELEVPGDGSVATRRREAVGVLYARLQTMESASRSELLHGLDADELGYASAESFWSSTARDALKQLPGVQPPASGASTWRFDQP